MVYVIESNLVSQMSSAKLKASFKCPIIFVFG